MPVRTFLVCLLLLLLPVLPPAPAVRAADELQAVAPILFPAESLFKAMERRDDRETWRLLSAKSRQTILETMSGALSKPGQTAVPRDAIARDFEEGGPVARGYWDGFLRRFDPREVIEKSQWEIGSIGEDRAEILIKYLGFKRPARLLLVRENGEWKVGLVETFWKRRSF